MPTGSSRTVIGISSILFLGGAIGLWIIGSYALTSYKHVDSLSSVYYTLVPASVILSVGVLFFLSSILGCCAAGTEGRNCFLSFFLMVTLTVLLLVASTVLAFAYKSEMNGAVEKETTNSFQKYGQVGENATTEQIDYLQHTFTCCGSNGYEFWQNTTFAEEHPHHVPLSCCKDESSCFDGDLDRMPEKKTGIIYEAGCAGEVTNYLVHGLNYVGAGAAAYIVLLVLAAMVSFFRCFCFCRNNSNNF